MTREDMVAMATDPLLWAILGMIGVCLAVIMLAMFAVAVLGDVLGKRQE